jgi:hypothetical protein
MTDRPAGPRLADSVRASRPEVRGPGSSGQAAKIAETVTHGLAQGADAATASLPGGTVDIPQLRLRLPASAGEAEIARALQRALAGSRRGHSQ